MIAVGVDRHSTNLPDSGEVTHNEIRLWSNQAILEVFSLFLLPFPRIILAFSKMYKILQMLEKYHPLGRSHNSDCIEQVLMKVSQLASMRRFPALQETVISLHRSMYKTMASNCWPFDES